MSTNLISSGTTARQKVNLRTPDVMAAVQQQVESHYRSDIIEKVRRAGGIISVGDTTVRLAKQFGFCYGVERAIDLAYAARKVFKDRRLFIVGEIIHNPEVNHQIASLGIKNLTGKNKEADFEAMVEFWADFEMVLPVDRTKLNGAVFYEVNNRGNKTAPRIIDIQLDERSILKRNADIEQERRNPTAPTASEGDRP